jgi:hypothetical protein
MLVVSRPILAVATERDPAPHDDQAALPATYQRPRHAREFRGQRPKLSTIGGTEMAPESMISRAPFLHQRIGSNHLRDSDRLRLASPIVTYVLRECQHRGLDRIPICGSTIVGSTTCGMAKLHQSSFRDVRVYEHVANQPSTSSVKLQVVIQRVRSRANSPPHMGYPHPCPQDGGFGRF